MLFNYSFKGEKMKLQKLFELCVVFCLMGVVTSFAKPSEPISFSFASDEFHSGPTFYGEKNRIYAKAELDLVIDLNNHDYGGQVTFLSNFVFEGYTYKHTVFPYGGQYLHVWRVEGRGYFNHASVPTSPMILSFGFSQAVLTSISSSSYAAGETLTLQVSYDSDPNIAFYSGAPLIGLGVDQWDVRYGQDLAFTFTNTNPIWSLIPLTRDGLFQERWSSEGSFSASTIGLPADYEE